MAETPDPNPIKTAEESEKEITCAICCGHYRDPKILPCMHYFCANCLQRRAARIGQPVSCPKCHREATFDDVKTLLTPFFINRMISLHERVEKALGRSEALCELCNDRGNAEAFCKQCVRFICGDCVIMHNKLVSTTFRDHTVVMLEHIGPIDVVASEAPISKCPEHDESLKMFCFTCNCLICRDCIIDSHTNHDRKFVRKAASECRDQLKASLASLQRGHTEISSIVETVMERERDILENKSNIEVTIGRSIDSLIKAQKQLKRQLLCEVSILTEESLSAVRAQQKFLALSLAEAQSMVEFVEQSLERATDEELLEMQQEIISRVEESRKKQQQMNLEPAAQSNVRVAMPTSGTLELCTQGQVYVAVVDPLKCRVERKGPEEAEVNKPAEFLFSVQLADSHSHRVEGPCDVKVIARSLVDGLVSQAIVTPAGNETYNATYTPINRGRHSLSVQLNGTEVESSRFTMRVCLSPTQLKKPVRHFGGAQGPHSITISKSGDLIVAECPVIGSGDVVVFNKLGEKVKEIKQTSDKALCGVSIDHHGNIYVSCSQSPIVGKFSRDQQILLMQTKIKIKGNELRMIRVIDAQVFVCSKSDYAVIVLDCRNLYEIRRFGRKGSGNGEFNYPIDVVAGEGELYVSDYKNHRIQIFSMEGKFIRSFIIKDPATQKKYTPGGLCIGPDRLLYVTCSGPDHLFAFTLAGTCVASIDVDGKPAGIAADTDGFLYVCMRGSDTIDVF